MKKEVEDAITQIRQRRLEKTKDRLRQIGLKECTKCNHWMDAEYIKEEEKCDTCHKEDTTSGVIKEDIKWEG
jgi:hypothetical protein